MDRQKHRESKCDEPFGLLQDLTEEDKRILMESFDENQRKGSFERLYPSATPFKYSFLHKTMPYYDRLLNQWNMKYLEDSVYAINLLKKSPSGSKTSKPLFYGLVKKHQSAKRESENTTHSIKTQRFYSAESLSKSSSLSNTYGSSNSIDKSMKNSVVSKHSSSSNTITDSRIRPKDRSPIEVPRLSIPLARNIMDQNTISVGHQNDLRYHHNYNTMLISQRQEWETPIFGERHNENENQNSRYLADSMNEVNSQIPFQSQHTISSLRKYYLDEKTTHQLRYVQGSAIDKPEENYVDFESVTEIEEQIASADINADTKVNPSAVIQSNTKSSEQIVTHAFLPVKSSSYVANRKKTLKNVKDKIGNVKKSNSIDLWVKSVPNVDGKKV